MKTTLYTGLQAVILASLTVSVGWAQDTGKAEAQAPLKSEKSDKAEKVAKPKAEAVITESADGSSAPGSAAPSMGSTAINPMTGKLLSEELLQRQLSIARLKTALKQEEIKIRQLDRTDQAESDRLRSDRQKLERDAATVRSLRMEDPTPRRATTTNRTARAQPKKVEPAPEVSVAPQLPPISALVPPPPPPPQASGTIKIGEETLRPATSYNGIDARVSFVDEQKTAGPAGAAPSGPSLPIPQGAVFVPAGTQPPGLPTVGQPMRANATTAFGGNSVPAMPSPIFPPR